MKHGLNNDDKPVLDNDDVYISNQKIEQNIYHVYLHEEISSLQGYREFLHLLRTAAQTDMFIIYINNFGGNLHTCIDIVHAMQSCQGTITTVITGPIYSAAPLIALQGHKIFMNENTFMMFHDYSTMEVGKGNEIEKSTTHYRGFFSEFMGRMCKKFLTRKEISNVLSGKDLYLSRDECHKRLKKNKRLLELTK